MTLHVKDAGSWKSVTPYVKDGGTWKAITNAYVKDGGTWKEFFASGTSYDRSIQASQLTTGSLVSTASLQLSGTGGTPWTWSVVTAGTNPAGFYDSSSVGAVQDNFGLVTLTSNCKTASAGTRVILNYNITCTCDSITVEPLYLQIVHQF